MKKKIKKVLEMLSKNKDIVLEEDIDYEAFLFLKDLYKNKKINIKISGSSMYPTFKEGDSVQVGVLGDKKLLGKLKKDINIAFFDHDFKKMIIHRIVKVKNVKQVGVVYRTKGDNLKEEDKNLVCLGNILGVVKD